MYSMDYVDNIINQLKTAGAKKPDIITQISPLTLGWPYVFGAWGEECDPANRRRRVRSDHPTIQSACQVLNGSKSTCVGCKWDLPVRMFDCRGYTDWLLKQVGIDLQGEGCTSQYNNDANWVEKGDISKMPRDKVCCVFKGTDKTKEHTGMYMGDGDTIYDCSSGVQKHSITNKAWKYYALPKNLYDGVTPTPTPEPTPDPGTAIVTGKNLALRQGPGTDKSVMTRIPTGTVIQLEPIPDDWTYVKYRNKVGFVMTKYIRKG